MASNAYCTRIVLFVVCVGCGGVCHAQTNEDLKMRFLTEATRAWQDYVAFADRLQGTTLVRYAGIETYTIELKHNADCGLTSGPKELVAFNKAYTFRLTRKSSEPAFPR